MSQVKLILQNPSFSDFYADNPEFDLLAHDFFTKAEGRISLAGADRHAGTLEMMKAYQRVLRLFPHRNEFAAMAAHEHEPIAERMIAAGLGSAHHIADLTALQFRRNTTDTCGADPALARSTQPRAVEVPAHDGQQAAKPPRTPRP